MLSPPAWGRGLKQMKAYHQVGCHSRPPRGGVD